MLNLCYHPAPEMSLPHHPRPRLDDSIIRTAIQKTTRPTPTSMNHHLVSYGVRDCIQRSSDEMVERLYVAGEQMLSMCLSHVLFLQPLGYRPISYYSVSHSVKMNSRLMNPSDHPDRHLIPGYLCSHYGTSGYRHTKRTRGGTGRRLGALCGGVADHDRLFQRPLLV